jgi:hypothetical protein
MGVTSSPYLMAAFFVELFYTEEVSLVARGSYGRTPNRPRRTTKGNPTSKKLRGL